MRGGLWDINHKIIDIGLNSYAKLFHICVVPVIDYCAGVIGSNFLD